jgi:hypothetical protein
MIQAHIERTTRGNAIERSLRICQMAAVLMEEIFDERFRATLARGCDHECVLEFCGDASQVECRVAAPHSFEVDCAYP